MRPWRIEGRNAAERKPWAAIWGGGGAGGGGGGGKASGSRDGVEMAWCDATQGAKPLAHCACRYDGLDGYLCQHPTAQFCLNQCSHRGACRFGFCLCEQGWWGVDCSIEAPNGLPPLRARAPTAAVRRLRAAPPPPLPAPPPRRRLRPLIYVYEMPSVLTTALLQRRHDKLFCVPRTYLQRNATQFAYGIYQGYVLEVCMVCAASTMATCWSCYYTSGPNTHRYPRRVATRVALIPTSTLAVLLREWP